MVLKSFWSLLKVSFKDWWDDNTFRLAASLAFYTTFSLSPILLIAVSIASLVFSQEHATKQIAGQIQTLIGTQGASAVTQVIRGLGKIGGNPLAIVVGVLTLIIGSTAVFAELQSALNLIWDVQPNPQRSMIKGLVRARLRSFAIVLGVGFLLLVSLVISAALSAVQTYFSSHMEGFPLFWKALNALASYVVVTLLFAMIYKYLPDVKITWRDVAVGSMVTAILFTGGKFLIGLYIGQTAISSTYGAAGSFAVLLIWVYYSALICFFGAEFTQVWARRYGSLIRPEPYAIHIGKKTDQI